MSIGRLVVLGDDFCCGLCFRPVKQKGGPRLLENFLSAPSEDSLIHLTTEMTFGMLNCNDNAVTDGRRHQTNRLVQSDKSELLEFMGGPWTNTGGGPPTH